MTHPELVQHATLYLEPHNAAIVNPLGFGTDGAVWYTTRLTAVKAFHKSRNFELELECYHRLQAAELQKVGGFWVSQAGEHHAEELGSGVVGGNKRKPLHPAR